MAWYRRLNVTSSRSHRNNSTQMSPSRYRAWILTGFTSLFGIAEGRYILGINVMCWPQHSLVDIFELSCHVYILRTLSLSLSAPRVSLTYKLFTSDLNKDEEMFKFRVCKSVHHHTFNWINQPDAATPQVYYLSFKYSSTCFGHPHAHHQELQQLQ